MTEYFRVSAAITLIVSATTLTTFLLSRMENVARSVPLLQALSAIFLMVGARIAVRLWFANRARLQSGIAIEETPGGVRPQTVLVVGLATLTVLYLRSIAELARDKVRVAGILSLDEHNAGQSVRHYPVFGPGENLPNLLKTLAVHGVLVDRIVVSVPQEDLPRRVRDDIAEASTLLGIHVDYLPERLGIPSDRAEPIGFRPQRLSILARQAQISVFNMEALRAIARRRFWKVKRVVDALLAGVLMVLLIPLYLIVATMVAIAVGFPTIFWQDRPGLGGKPFKLFKFRTMGFAYDRDGRPIPEEDRLNAVGRLLRATRLDELPQLWNIFIGEMSFIGPRPLLHVEQPAAFAARLLVRPGLTGWAQIQAGRQASVSDKAALDVWYVQNARFSLDLRILLQTVPIVLFGERRHSKAIEQAWTDLRRDGYCMPTVPASLPEPKDLVTSGAGLKRYGRR